MHTVLTVLFLLVFFSSLLLVNVSAESGDVIWKYDTGAAVPRGPLLFGGLVCYTSLRSTGNLVCLTKSGALSWWSTGFSSSTVGAAAPPYATPAQTRYFYFGVEGRLYRVDTSYHRACQGRENGCRSIVVNDGDCDRNSDCQSGLRCGANNCDFINGGTATYPAAMNDPDGSDDCCYPSIRPELRTRRFSGYTMVQKALSTSTSPGVSTQARIYVGTAGNGLKILKTGSLDVVATLLPSSTIESAIILRDDDNSTVFFVSRSDRTVVAVDTSTNAVIWTFPLGADAADPKSGSCAFAPSSQNGTVVFPSGNRTIFGLDARTGRLKWKFDTPPAATNADAFPAVATAAHQRLSSDDSSPQYFTSNAYGGLSAVFWVDSDGAVNALNASTGILLWRRVFSGSVRAVGSVAYSNQIVYATCDDGRIRALSALRRGIVLWTSSSSDLQKLKSWSAPPAIAGGVLYVSRFDPAKSTSVGTLFTINISRPHMPPTVTQALTQTPTSVATETGEPTSSMSHELTETHELTQTSELTMSKQPTASASKPQTHSATDSETHELTATSFTHPLSASASQTPSASEKRTYSRNLTRTLSRSLSESSSISPSLPTASLSDPTASHFPECDPLMVLKLVPVTPEEKTMQMLRLSRAQFVVRAHITLRPASSSASASPSSLVSVTTRFAREVPLSNVSVWVEGGTAALLSVRRESLQVLRLSFQLLESDELTALSLRVTISQSSFDCQLPSSQAAASSSQLTYRRGFDFVSKEVVQAAKAGASVAQFLGPLAGGGAIGTAMHVQRNEAVRTAMACRSADPGEPLNTLLSPTALVVGDDAGRFARGALVGNAVIVVGFWLVHTLAVVAFSLYTRKPSHKDQSVWSLRARSRMKYPGVGFIVAAVLIAGNTVAASQLIRVQAAAQSGVAAATDWCIMVGTFCVFGVQYYCVIWPMFPIRRFYAQTLVRKSRNKGAPSRRIDGFALKCRRFVKWLYEIDYEWVQRRTHARQRRRDAESALLKLHLTHEDADVDLEDIKEKTLKQQQHQDEQQQQQQQQQHLLLTSEDYGVVDTTTPLPPYLVRRYGEAFDSLKRRVCYASLAECLLALSAAVGEGLGAVPGTPSCYATQLLMALVVGCTALLSFNEGVYLAHWENRVAWVTGGCVTLSGIVALLIALYPREFEMIETLNEILAVTDLVLLFVSSAKAIQDIGVTVTEWFIDNAGRTLGVFARTASSIRRNQVRAQPRATPAAQREMMLADDDV